MADSRGNAISAYSPAFNKGAQVYAANRKAAQITGAVISAGITYAVAHGLAAVPSIVIVGIRSTMALISAGGANIGEASASARTSTNVYITAEQHGIGYAVYCEV